MADYKIKGMKELEKLIKDLGKLPQKTVDKAARSGADIALRPAKENAPVESGTLKEHIVTGAEKSKVTGKKVYRIGMAPNDDFVKISKEGNRSYYPASQEFGFITRDGGYVQGKHFLRDSIDQNAEQIKKKVVEVLTAEIDKLR